ncbi:hypothetical protein PR202_gb29186 [Eleusine coracana subsp. coracana]|uniref:SGF29 C-terminal domain-containing protein n=1 Tax=Eleusine coracana subsp. coracana TaxID=191504 RepID=A0AAV5FYW2_ELECO|nr:hypothetical protein PR202_gb29186 [Eleusine coracana subsp. coracana]
MPDDPKNKKAEGTADDMAALLQAVLTKLDRLDVMEAKLDDHNAAISRLEQTSQDLIPANRTSGGHQRDTFATSDGRGSHRDGQFQIDGRGAPKFHKIDFPKYEVLDEEPGDDEESTQKKYKLPMNYIIPFPKKGDPSSAPDFGQGRQVLAIVELMNTGASSRVCILLNFVRFV